MCQQFSSASYGSQYSFISTYPFPFHSKIISPSTCNKSKPSFPTMLAASNSKRKRSLSPTNINRQARARYEFLETYECGIELLGTEIKSVRNGKINLRDGYARVTGGELFLYNVHISPWDSASSKFNHDPVRSRRLLLHKRSIRKLESKQSDSGLTMVPIRTYFGSNGFLKVEVALAKGKQLHDKREDIKKRDVEREMNRVIKFTLNS